MVSTRNHLSGNKAKAAKRSAASSSGTVPKASKIDEENEELKVELARAHKKLKLVTSATKSASKPGNQSAMQREVSKAAKTVLWKVCKFLKNEAKLDKAAAFLMTKLELPGF